MSSRIYYQRSIGGNWEDIPTPSQGSMVRFHLDKMQPGDVWSDGYGNEYKWERDDG